VHIPHILHASNIANTAAVCGHVRGVFRLFVVLCPLLSLVTPAAAWGDIYKWTDERGSTNFSNLPPPNAAKAKNVEIVAKETSPAPIPEHVATATEQALLARIKDVERQLQAAKIAAQTPPPRPPAPAGGYYPAMQAPPPGYSVPPPVYSAPPADYYDNTYDSGYYPSYTPTYYYPVVPAYPFAVYPRRAYFARPGFAGSRGGSFGGSFRGGGHGGRR
jgi:hypothetical protein